MYEVPKRPVFYTHIHPLIHSFCPFCAYFRGSPSSHFLSVCCFWGPLSRGCLTHYFKRKGTATYRQLPIGGRFTISRGRENRSHINFLTEILRDPGSRFLPLLCKTKTSLRPSIPHANSACSTPLIKNKSPHEESFYSLVRVGRIELPSHPWQGRVLPLNHTRNETFCGHKLLSLLPHKPPKA